MATVGRIDDADSSRVVRNGNWPIAGDSKQYNGTLSSSMEKGDSLRVNFKGSFIAVFGLFDLNSEGVVTNYSIDGAPPAQVTTPANAGDGTRQQFWIKKGMAFGQHTLDITMDKTNPGIDPTLLTEGSIWFDYFLVDDPSVPTSVDSSVNLPQPQDSHGSGPAIPVGAIVGIVIGGLFFLLGAAYIFLLWYRMKREAPRYIFGEKKSHKRQTSIEPFLLSHHIMDASTSSSQLAAVSSSERLTFDPNLFVRGPPPDNRKSMAATHIDYARDRDSRPPTGRSRTESMGQSSSTVTGGNIGLPPGAQPPIVPPPISIPMTALPARPSRPTTAHSSTSIAPSMTSSHSASHQRARDGSLHIEIIPPSEAVSVEMPETEDDPSPSPPPRQHVDSGVRAPDVILAHSARRKRVELPPVYSPV